MKVIFLDFDGPIIPLMSHTHRRSAREKAWPPCVPALNRITETTGSKIVVSSSWRRQGDIGLIWLRRLLRDWGVTGKVIGVTPEMSTMTGTLWKSRERGHEIQAWLNENPVERFLIFDDDEDMVHLDPYLIRTPFETGITENHADKAIQMLTPAGKIRIPSGKKRVAK